MAKEKPQTDTADNDTPAKDVPQVGEIRKQKVLDPATGKVTEINVQVIKQTKS